TADTTPTVKGTFDKDDGTVTQVVVNGKTYLASGSDLTVDAENGTWSLTIPAGNELTDATYEVAVTAVDALGNATTDTTSNELVIDTTGSITIDGDIAVLRGDGEKKDGDDEDNDDENNINSGDLDTILAIRTDAQDVTFTAIKDDDTSILPDLVWTDTDDDGETYDIIWVTNHEDDSISGYIDIDGNGKADTGKKKDDDQEIIVLQIKDDDDDPGVDMDGDGIISADEKDYREWKAEIKDNSGTFHQRGTPAADAGDLTLSFGIVGYDNDVSVAGTITLGIDQTDDSKVTIDGTAIDGIISGMRYETSSGFVGYTDENGALKYNLSDNVTFSVGSVVLGTVAASATMISGKVFLQDIVGVGLENITDDYVEKLAIFLQTLDNDGDAYNGIVITDEMHALFSDDNFDLEAITKEELVQLLLDNGLTPVDEDEAIQHVKDMITEHAGVTEFEEDDNDSISLLGDDEGLDLAWSLSDPEEPVDGMYLSDEADQVSLEIGDLLGDGIPDSDLSQYISVASDGLNTVIEVNSAGIGNTEGGASMSYTLEGVDLTTDTNGNALDTDSMNELLRNLYNGANDTGLM
ncbi:hypothetical protein N8295_04670, partial [Pseudomonadales bacterium]|nr:hypothetical protein [Pseudomonadales bacterium]